MHTGTKDAPRAISAQIPALALYRDGCRPLPSGGGSLFSSYRRSLEVASHKHWQGKPIANQASGQSENETSGPLPRIFCAVGGRSELRRIRIHPPTTRPTSQPASEPADRVVLASVGISGSSLLLSGTTPVIVQNSSSSLITPRSSPNAACHSGRGRQAAGNLRRRVQGRRGPRSRERITRQTNLHRAMRRSA